MKNKLVLGIFLFLTLMTSGVFASMVENSRQGFPAISAESQPVQDLGNPEHHQGLIRVLLELVSDSLFITSDPIGFLGGQNRYGYVNNNPVIYTDPYGLIGPLAVLAGEAGIELAALSWTALTGTVAYFQSPAWTQVKQQTWDWLKGKTGYGQTVTLDLPPTTQELANQEISLGNNPPLVWKTLLRPLLMAGPPGGNGEKPPQPGNFSHPWIKHDLFNQLQTLVGKGDFQKFLSALKKGIVGPKNESGIKVLQQAFGKYTHELKIGGSAQRLLGYINEQGVLVFDKFVRGGLH